MTAGPNSAHSQSLPGPRREKLNLAYQEVLTAIVRLRSGSQSITDVEKFRAQIRAALKVAEQEAARRGFSPEHSRLATFATVAFLDESILNSRNQIFMDWPRRPLQEELFGVHVAGEIFFRNVDHLLSSPDSQDLADVLEVHQICVLLGFRGRYSAGGSGELHAATQAMADKIRRIRGPESDLHSAWQPPAEAPLRAQDPWLRRLLWSAAGCCGLALVLLIAFKLLLASGAAQLQPIAERVGV